MGNSPGRMVEYTVASGRTESKREEVSSSARMESREQGYGVTARKLDGFNEYFIYFNYNQILNNHFGFKIGCDKVVLNASNFCNFWAPSFISALEEASLPSFCFSKTISRGVLF